MPHTDTHSARKALTAYRSLNPDPLTMDHAYHRELQARADAEDRADPTYPARRIATLEGYIAKSEQELRDYPNCPRREDTKASIARFREDIAELSPFLPARAEAA